MDPISSGLYLRYHLLVAYLLHDKRISVAELLEREFDVTNLERELKENRVMSRDLICVLTIFLVGTNRCWGQVAGNVNYAQPGGRARAEQIERNKRVLTKEELPPSGSSTFVEANVLMNVKADLYVAIFSITQEGANVLDCSQKMDGAIKVFSDELKLLGIGPADLFVDLVVQNKVYGYEVSGEIAREKLTGFELKKNVSVHYRSRELLDRLMLAAAKAQIFDLVKVDYIVKDTDRIQERLMDEAARIIKRKVNRYERLLGIKLAAPAQVYAERPAIHYPTDLYDSYTAYESENIDASLRQRLTTRSARKSRSFFFSGLDGSGFDQVINPLVVEPVVQFTLYLKLRYETDQTKAK